MAHPSGTMMGERLQKALSLLELNNSRFRHSLPKAQQLAATQMSEALTSPANIKIINEDSSSTISKNLDSLKQQRNEKNKNRI
jgi:hypothetical protein